MEMPIEEEDVLPVVDSDGEVEEDSAASEELFAFFSIPEHFDVLWEFSGKEKVHLDAPSGSLSFSKRLLEHFVIHYAQVNQTRYLIKCTNESSTTENRVFFVYNEYRKQVAKFGKPKFDFFCRHRRITVSLQDRECESSIGQMNFVRWAIETGIFRYISGHLAEIRADMRDFSRRTKKRKKEMVHTKKAHVDKDKEGEEEEEKETVFDHSPSVSKKVKTGFERRHATTLRKKDYSETSSQNSVMQIIIPEKPIVVHFCSV